MFAPSAFQQLLDPVDLLSALVDERLAMPCQFA
jgi:hypothetical protein